MAAASSEDVKKISTRPVRPYRVCASCGVKCKQLCTACRASYYCTRKCQKADWKSHQLECKAPKKGSQIKMNIVVVPGALLVGRPDMYARYLELEASNCESGTRSPDATYGEMTFFLAYRASDISSIDPFLGDARQMVGAAAVFQADVFMIGAIHVDRTWPAPTALVSVIVDAVKHKARVVDKPVQAMIKRDAASYALEREFYYTRGFADTKTVTVKLIENDQYSVAAACLRTCDLSAQLEALFYYDFMPRSAKKRKV